MIMPDTRELDRVAAVKEKRKCFSFFAKIKNKYFFLAAHFI